jgi:hypothetical protein
MNFDPVDLRPSLYWGLAGIAGSGGTFAGGNLFQLANLVTRRVHFMALAQGGYSLGPPSVSGSLGLGYSTFATRYPVSFADFDGARGMVGSLSAVAVVGYALGTITLWTARGSLLHPDLCCGLDISGWTGGLSIGIGAGVVLCSIVPVDVPYGEIPGVAGAQGLNGIRLMGNPLSGASEIAASLNRNYPRR